MKFPVTIMQDEDIAKLQEKLQDIIQGVQNPSSKPIAVVKRTKSFILIKCVLCKINSNAEEARKNIKQNLLNGVRYFMCHAFQGVFGMLFCFD